MNHDALELASLTDGDILGTSYSTNEGETPAVYEQWQMLMLISILMIDCGCLESLTANFGKALAVAMKILNTKE